jgi:hypothetical protein
MLKENAQRLRLRRIQCRIFFFSRPPRNRRFAECNAAIQCGTPRALRIRALCTGVQTLLAAFLLLRRQFAFTKGDLDG